MYFPGGFEEFEKHFAQQCAGYKETDSESTILGLRNLHIDGGNDEQVPTPDTNAPDPYEFPVQVLPYLFLGSAKNSSDHECLYKNGIKYILNVTPNVPNTFETDGNFKYMQIPISDHWSQNLAMFFPKAIAFIGEYLFV